MIVSLWCGLCRRVRRTRRCVITTVMGWWEDRPSYHSHGLFLYNSPCSLFINSSSLASRGGFFCFFVFFSSRAWHFCSRISFPSNVVNDINIPVAGYRRFNAFRFPLSLREVERVVRPTVEYNTAYPSLFLFKYSYSSFCHLGLILLLWYKPPAPVFPLVASRGRILFWGSELQCNGVVVYAVDWLNK